jgi:hypothetical protein
LDRTLQVAFGRRDEHLPAFVIHGLKHGTESLSTARRVAAWPPTLCSAFVLNQMAKSVSSRDNINLTAELAEELQRLKRTCGTATCSSPCRPSPTCSSTPTAPTTVKNGAN